MADPKGGTHVHPDGPLHRSSIVPRVWKSAPKGMRPLTQMSHLPGTDALAIGGDPATLGQLLRHLPVVLWAYDRELRFTVSEGGGLAAMGLEPGQVVGSSILDFFGTNDPEFPPLAAHLRTLQGEPGMFELEWVGRMFHAQLQPVFDAEEVVGGVGFALDVTAKETAEERVHEAERRYRSLVEQIPGVVYLAEPGEAGEWLYVSPQIEHVLGFPAEDWIADPSLWARQLHPDDRDRVLDDEERSRGTGDLLATEYRMLARDGRVVWFRDEAQIVQLEGRPVFRGILLDVTERARAAEEARRAEAETREMVCRLSETVTELHETDEARRRLMGRLVAAREEEHRRIATDVHDGPVQKMVAAGLRLQMFLRRELAPEDREELENVSRVVTATIAEMRQLLLELVPSTLETQGLAAALHEMLARLGERHGLQVSLESELATEPVEPWRTVCYRIAEDALRNIGKHAGATIVNVTLADGDGRVHMRITADGAGLDHDHVGLESALDRAALAGGRLEVSGEPGAGTTLDCWIPIEGD